MGTTVDLAEHSRTLDCFLKFIYPVEHPVLTRLGDALAVLQTGTKYMVDHLAKEALKQFV